MSTPVGENTARTRTWVTRLVVVLLLMGVVWAVGLRVSSSRTFQVAGELIPRVETTEKVVALTFDDGPTTDDLEPVLAALREVGVPATFYV